MDETLEVISEAVATAAPELSAAAEYAEQLDTIIGLLSYCTVCLIILVAICGITLIVKTFCDLTRRT